MAQNSIQDSKTRSIIYIPPDFNEVKTLMNSLISWVNSSIMDEVNILIIAGIFHYRFVTIHPFMDGNGRAARLLTNYILHCNGYEVAKYASLEKSHETDRKAYYTNLRKVQASNFYDIPAGINITTWLEYWLNCLNSAYKEALNRIEKLNIKDDAILTLDNRLQKSINLFKKYKRIKAAEYQTLMGLGRTQAVADLNKLVDMDIVKRAGGGRSTVYIIK